jgi:hypothetical protein
VERQKKEKKQQEEWEKREKARINLLYQVYDDRERKVNEHKAELEQELRMKEEDRQEVERRVRDYEKEQERKILLQELQREEEQQEFARQDYGKKIEERKQQGKEQLEQFKRTNRIF